MPHPNLLQLGLVKNRNRVPISNANDLPLKRLRVQGNTHHKKWDYKGEFHNNTLYHIWGFKQKNKRITFYLNWIEIEAKHRNRTCSTS